MVITYHGGDFFKVTQGDLTIAFNPISKQSKLEQTRFGADVALLSANHPDLNGVELVTHGGKKPFVISGPGEYEVGGLFIKGFASKTTYGGEERINTIYALKIDDIAICFLGALGDQDLSVEAKEAFDEVDILFVPIGGEGVLSAPEAYKFAVKREPSLIIPMHYGAMGEKDALKTFLKEAASEGTKPVDKLVLKKKDLTGTSQIAVLSIA
jgi:hypothetical protein